MLFEKVKDKSMDDFVLPFNSSEVLDAPSFKERMFLKNKKGREYLRNCMKDKTFPNFKETYLVKEANICYVKEMFDDLMMQGYRYIPDVVCDILHDVSAQSSTVNLFQVIDLDVLKDLEKNLRSPAQHMTDEASL